MADTLYLSRDSKLFVSTPAGFKETDAALKWEVPILEGFSISQTDNSSEVTTSEAVGANGITSRGMHKFKTSTNPCEFSFQTYVRPYKTGNTGATEEIGATNKFSGQSSNESAPELVLWALMASATQLNDDGHYVNPSAGTAASPTGVVVNPGVAGANPTVVDFSKSVIAQAAAADLIFEVNEMTGNTATQYTAVGAVISEATIDFDIEGIATISWTGTAKSMSVTSGQAKIVGDVSERLTGSASPAKFIQNKLSQVVLDPASGGLNSGTAYNLVLTGGSITFSNSVEFITPEQIHTVNDPIAHYLGTLSITGSLTCYLNGDTNSSLKLLTDSLSHNDTVNSNALNVTIGAAAGPNLKIKVDNAHIDIPSTSFDDVVSLDIGFTALGASNNIANSSQVSLEYKSGES